jgi:hypothetical protein
MVMRSRVTYPVVRGPVLRGPVVRTVLATAAIGVLATVSACGRVVAGASGHPAASASTGAQVRAAPLCADAGSLTKLVVRLTGGLPNSHFHEVIPAGATISDPARVRAVAAGLCALPRTAPGVYHCPADFGGGYRLTFSAPGRTFPPVMAQATGCRSVTGLGPARVAGASFWALLHTELSGGRGAGASGGPVSP